MGKLKGRLFDKLTVTPPKGPLSVEAWCTACLHLIIREGVQAVAVEPMTRELGVTKGSFYWHFKSRDALIEETLRRWEAFQSQDVMIRYAGITDPVERMRILMFAAFEALEDGLVYAALSASSEDPRVKPYLQRVSEFRVNFIGQAFEALGFEAAEARRRALFAYSTYVGYFHLLRAIPDQVRDVTDLSAYVHYLADSLVPKGLQAPTRG